MQGQFRLRAAGLGLLVLVATNGLGQVTIPDRKVTFASPGIPAAKLLPLLSEKIGIPLSTAPQTAEDVLVLSVTDVPAKDLMARIAETVGGSWKQSGSGLMLVRTADETRIQVKQDAELRSKEIRDRLAAIAKLPPSKPFTPEAADNLAKGLLSAITAANKGNEEQFWGKLQKLSNQGPMGGAFRKLIPFLPFEAFLEGKPRFRFVFSTKPNASEQPLDAGVFEIAKQLLAEQTIWASAASKYALKGPRARYGGTYSLGALEYNQASSNKPVVRVLLTTYKWDKNNDPNIGLYLVAADGSFIFQTEQSLGSLLAGNLPDTDNKPAETPDPLTVEMPPSAKQLLEKLTTQEGRKKRDPQLMQVVTHPEDVEPISVCFGPMILSIGEAKHEQVIGLANDDVFVTWWDPKRKINVKEWLKGLGYQLTVSESNGWLTFHPKHPVASRESRTPRRALGKYIRGISDNVQPTIDQMAEWFADIPDDSRLVDHYQQIAQPDNASYWDKRQLRLYGSLTLAQRKSAATEAGLPFSKLLPNQISLVEDLLCDQNTYLQYNPEYRNNMTPAEMEEINKKRNLFWNGVYHFAQEAFPNGLPKNGTLKLTELKEDAVFCESTTEYMNFGAMSAQSIAWQLYSQSHPEIFPWMQEENQAKIDTNRMRAGWHRIITLDFKFTPELSYQVSLNEDHKPSGPPITMAQLPKSTTDAINKALEEYKKQYANVKPGDMGYSGGSTPPPATPR